jgi:hypothetical protein
MESMYLYATPQQVLQWLDEQQKQKVVSDNYCEPEIKSKDKQVAAKAK